MATLKLQSRHAAFAIFGSRESFASTSLCIDLGQCDTSTSVRGLVPFARAGWPTGAARAEGLSLAIVAYLE